MRPMAHCREAFRMTAGDDLGFACRTKQDGAVLALRGGQLVTTLRGIAVAEFLAQIGNAEPAAAQQLLAHVTGNYKRGNERTAAAIRPIAQRTGGRAPVFRGRLPASSAVTSATARRGLPSVPCSMYVTAAACYRCRRNGIG